MSSDDSKELLRDLFEEYSEWYFTLAEERGSVPRSISGVSGDGSQFIYLIDEVTLQPIARNKYIRFVLNEHHSSAYAYGGIALRGDNDPGEIEEVLDVVTADSDHYCMGRWRVMRGEQGEVSALVPMGFREGDDPEKHQATWYLAGSIRFTDSERQKYGALWEADRPAVIFRDRDTGI
jgi:hypothetical protein